MIDYDLLKLSVSLPRTMIPACGTAPEPAGNASISGEFPQVPMLFLPELTGKILGTWQQYSGRKKFVPGNARFRHFFRGRKRRGNTRIPKGTAWNLPREIAGTHRILKERIRIPVRYLSIYRNSSCH